MAARPKNKCQDSISSVASSSILSLERFSFESQISTDPSVLDLSSCDDSLPINSQDHPDNARATNQSIVVHSVLADGPPQDDHLHALQSWPTSPQPVVISTHLMTWYITVDIALLAISFAFLVFAILVVSYDQKPTGSHQRAALKFEQASKWVGHNCLDLNIDSLTGCRARQYILYFLLLLLDEPLIRFYFGELRKANPYLLWTYWPEVRPSPVLLSRNSTYERSVM